MNDVPSFIPKRVLLTTPPLTNPGGVAYYYRTILPYLNTEEYDISVLEIGSKHNRNKDVFHWFTDQLRLGLSLRSKPCLVHLNPSLNYKSFIRDAFFVTQAKLRKLPVLVFFRGWNCQFENTVDSRLQGIFRSTYGRADAFIVLASEFEKRLRSWGITAPIYRLTTTVDGSLLDGFDIENRIGSFKNNGIMRFLFLSRLEKAKGIFEAVDAINILYCRGHKVSLGIAGDGPIRKELESYVRRLALAEGMVTFLGYVTGKEKALAFQSHDLFLFPSYSEGLPNVVLEAMALGMPVITTAVGGIKDLQEQYNIGAVVPGPDPLMIADRIETLIADRGNLCSISSNNHRIATDNFVGERVAVQLSDVYRCTIKSVIFTGDQQ